MSGIRAARDLAPITMPTLATVPSTPSAPSPPGEARQVQVMQDLLYDILATGVDAERTDVSIEAIERFLHEHARAPKSLADFRGFFAQQGLTSRIQPANAPDVAALPPLKRIATAPPRRSVPPELPIARPPSSMELESHPVRLDLPGPAGVASPRGRSAWAPLAMAACTLVAAAALYAGSMHLIELRTELVRSEQKAQENRELIEALREQAVSFESSLAANGQLIERVEQKSDLVIESLDRATEAMQPKRKR